MQTAVRWQIDRPAIDARAPAGAGAGRRAAPATSGSVIRPVGRGMGPAQRFGSPLSVERALAALLLELGGRAPGVPQW